MENNELYIFLKNEINKNIDDNSPNLRLEKDLNIYGDDAVEFLEKFSKKFNVNITNFNFDQYFNPEIDKISLFLKNIFNKNIKSDLTINDLKEAIVKGKLE